MGKEGWKEEKENMNEHGEHTDIYFRVKRRFGIKMHCQAISCSAGIQIGRHLPNNMPKDIIFSLFK